MSLQVIVLPGSETVIVSLSGLVGIARKKQGGSDQQHNQNRLRMALSFVDSYQPPITRKAVGCKKEQIAQHKTAQQKYTDYIIMACHNPRCLGNYDFDHIAFFARKRFVEGCDTVTLLEQAESECEKEEIALVCLLDVEDNKIRDLQLCCRHAGHCKVIDCRDKLKKMIGAELANRESTAYP